jgi:hypothetical protein
MNDIIESTRDKCCIYLTATWPISTTAKISLSRMDSKCFRDQNTKETNEKEKHSCTPSSVSYHANDPKHGVLATGNEIREAITRIYLSV